MRDSSTSDAKQVSLAEFYSADAEVFQAKYKQLEHLIGRGHHGPSEGDYCEDLLREFLRRALPGRYAVDTGFIRRVSEDCSGVPPEPEIATPQLDIIVHDSINYAPIFRSGDFVVVRPEAARAVIEVKKCLNSVKLKEAVKTIGRTRHLLRRWDAIGRCNVFTCIFAFSSRALSLKSKQYSESVKTIYSDTMNVFDGRCEAPDLLIALPELAFLRHGGNKVRFNHCRIVPIGHKEPNIAGQLLLFMIVYGDPGAMSRAFQFPSNLQQELAFEFTERVSGTTP